MSNNSFWDAFYLKSALFSGFKKFQLLLHWNPSVFPKKTGRLTAFRILQQYYALRPTVVKTITKISDYQNFRGLFGRNIVGFLKKTHFLNAMRSLIQKDHLKHFLKKLGHVQPLWENVGFFSKKNHLSSQENLSSERFRFETSQSNAMFGTPPRTNLTTVSDFEKINLFSKNPSVFTEKNEKLEPSEKFWAFSLLKSLKVILQEFCQLKRLWKRWNSFPKTPM